MSIALRIPSIAAASIVMVVAFALPASATTTPRTLVVNGNSTISVEYGQGWTVSLTRECFDGAALTVARGGKTIATIDDSFYGMRGSLSSYEIPPLSVGTSTLALTAATSCGPETATVQVKVAAAPLTLDARITQDPSATGNAIVSMAAKGDLIDRLTPAAYRGPNEVRFPAGTWAVTVVDAAKKTVYEKKIAGQLGDPAYVTAYWMGTPPDQTLTATATFTPSGDTADDVVVTQPDPFPFTTTDRAAQSLVRPADDGPPAGAVPIGFTVPLWSVVAASVVALAALVVAAVGFVRWRRARSVPATRNDSGTAVTRA